MPDNDIIDLSEEEEEESREICYFIDDFVRFLIRFDIDAIPKHFILLRNFCCDVYALVIIILYVINKLLSIFLYVAHGK